MTEPISEQKAQLRKQCRAIRKSLGEERRVQASLAIYERIEGWIIFQKSQTILTYMPIKSEADLTPLLERHPQKRWVLPRIIPAEDNRMVFHPYDAHRLVTHPFGMAEPALDSPVVDSAEIELTLTPGLAFDRLGFRLGYGGGYYDRFLSNFHGVSAGIVFHDLLFDNIPHSAHDIPMHWIITERGPFVTQRGD